MQYHVELMSGEFLLHIMFSHTLMDTLGAGVFFQARGFTMHTNSTLALRAFENRNQYCHACAWHVSFRMVFSQDLYCILLSMRQSWLNG